MLCQLRRHPDTPCDAVEAIEVDVRRDNAQLMLRYRVTGRIRDIKIPAATSPTRADELWKHTCFEAFIKNKLNSYLELNFSPSTAWAACAFSGYREGMQLLSVLPPEIEMESSDTSVALCTATSMEMAPKSRLGLSAVIEETNGRRSYWALAHPPGKPDFHHPDCFALELPPASAA